MYAYKYVRVLHVCKSACVYVRRTYACIFVCVDVYVCIWMHEICVCMQVGVVTCFEGGKRTKRTLKTFIYFCQAKSHKISSLHVYETYRVAYQTINLYSDQPFGVLSKFKISFLNPKTIISKSSAISTKSLKCSSYADFYGEFIMATNLLCTQRVQRQIRSLLL